jgi:hypothetical protein
MTVNDVQVSAWMEWVVVYVYFKVVSKDPTVRIGNTVKITYKRGR